MKRWLLLCSLAVLGCPRANEASTKPGSSASSAPIASASTPPAPPEKSGLLPPLETACASDADCTHAWMYEIDGKCCNGTCSPKATTKAWVEKVDAICAKAGHSDACPVKKCAAPPPVICTSGKCVLGTGVDPKW